MPEIWDLEDEENQRKEPLCTLLKQNPGPHFKRVFRNSVYDVLKINTSWFYHLWHIDDLNAIDLFIEILPNSGCVSALAHAFMYISKQERMSVQNKQCMVDYDSHYDLFFSFLVNPNKADISNPITFICSLVSWSHLDVV